MCVLITSICKPCQIQIWQLDVCRQQKFFVLTKSKLTFLNKMSDFLKSAMGYFNTSPNGGLDNDFIGKIVEVGSVKLRVKRVIAEGLCTV